MRLLPGRLVLWTAIPLLAAGLAGCDAEQPAPGHQYTVSGVITNTSNRPIEGALVHVGGFDTTTGPDGTYATTVPADNGYQFSVEAEGYTTITEEVNVGGDVALDRVLHGPNQVHGQVVNSQTGQGLPDALVGFILPGHSTDDPHLLATTDATGFFNITDAPDGTFTLCIRKVGFLEYCQENVHITGGTFALDPIALVEQPPAGSFRIVVTWGATPNDLDTHLTGPDGAGGRFHVYYASASAGGATLDHDDTSSYGPETVTITTPHDGMYRYSIYNFSDQSTTGAQGIAASPTRVQVYGDTGLLKSYTAPTATSGNTWRVFEMTVSGTTRTFSDNGGASLGYVEAANSSDTGVFLTGGGGPAPTKAPSL